MVLVTTFSTPAVSIPLSSFHRVLLTTHCSRIHLATAVDLGQWEIDGVQYAISNPTPKPILMDEFNTASCGGLPGISETFSATLWTVDYALQLASVGYSAAYAHTREPGVTYNLFQPPSSGSQQWTTGAPFYSYLALMDALSVSSSNGSIVQDLNIANSTTDYSVTTAGYAMYDAGSKNVSSLMLFNFANTSATMQNFTLPSGIFANSSRQITVRYLVAPTVDEDTYIAYGGETYAGVTDGLPVTANWSAGGVDASRYGDVEMDCSGGCDMPVPGPGLAVVFVGSPYNSSTSSSSGNSSGGNTTDTSSAAGVLFTIITRYDETMLTSFM